MYRCICACESWLDSFDGKGVENFVNMKVQSSNLDKDASFSVSLCPL